MVQRFRNDHFDQARASSSGSNSTRARDILLGESLNNESRRLSEVPPAEHAGDASDYLMACRSRAIAIHTARHRAEQQVSNQHTECPRLQPALDLTQSGQANAQPVSEADQLVQIAIRRAAIRERLRERLSELRQGDLVVGRRIKDESAEPKRENEVNRTMPLEHSAERKHGDRPDTAKVNEEKYKQQDNYCFHQESLPPKVQPVDSTHAVGMTYVVKKGDTLTSIARSIAGPNASPLDIYNCVKDIARLNAIRNPNLIRANDHLVLPAVPVSCVPCPAPSRSEPVLQHEYTVKQGDTLCAIAEKSGTEKQSPLAAILERTKALAKFNKLKNPNLIYPAQKIRLSND